MHFTREPIIESVITPREGCKLVVRNSKGIGQEEFFVDAVEVVNFGKSCFLRSLERPKAFLVPASDYEILEVRETRVVLKHVAIAERSIKISSREKGEAAPAKRASRKEKEEVSPERKKERRKRRRRSSEDKDVEAAPVIESETILSDSAEGVMMAEAVPTPVAPIPRVIPPPKTLISESINRYKEMLNTPTGSEGSSAGRLKRVQKELEPSLEQDLE